MIYCILGTSIQWLEFTKTIYLGHFIIYYVLPEGVAILSIRIDVLIDIFVPLYSILVFDGVLFSINRKYTGNTNELLGIISEATCLIPLGNVEELIIYVISRNSEISILLAGINMITCIFYSAPYHFYFPTIIY